MGMKNMRAICDSLGFDPTNHHNALKCPYCNPNRLVPAEQADDIERQHKVDRQKTLELNLLVQENRTLWAALFQIQRAGNDNHPTAIWMQKVAAHALYPQQWPAQPADSPSPTTKEN